jgi:hypothetical protein
LEKDPLKETPEQEEVLEDSIEVESDDIFLVDELFIEEKQVKKPNFGFMVAGFFVPILGYAMYFVYKKEGKKVEADSFLDGAMIGTFTFILVLILVIGYVNSL